MKSKITKILFSLAIGSVVFGLVLAGTLDPPGPPAPTMVTLQQIYDKVCAPVDVAKTGQTGCWDGSGNPISCAGTGQDGALQKGVSVSPRFADNGDGTVKDNLTGLIWLKRASCFGSQTWEQAILLSRNLASGLSPCTLSDGSVAGDWRLPNLKELQSLMDYDHVNPSLPDAGVAFTGVVTNANYWTSTTRKDSPNSAYSPQFGYGSSATDLKTTPNYVWPVRGGQ